MKNRDMGNTQWLGSEADLWNNVPQEDLVAIRAREYSDAMTTWFATHFIDLYHRYIGRYIHKVPKDSIRGRSRRANHMPAELPKTK